MRKKTSNKSIQVGIKLESARKIPSLTSLQNSTRVFPAAKKSERNVNQYFSSHGCKKINSVKDGGWLTFECPKVVVNKLFQTKTDGAVIVPAELRGCVKSIHGVTETKLYRHPQKTETDDLQFFPDEYAELYDFPEKLTGKKQRVAIIELGGGFERKYLKEYFSSRNVRLPKLNVVSVDGVEPTTELSPASVEVYMDIEILGLVAPDAAMDVYFAPSTQLGLMDALHAAIYAKKPPNVISLSWGTLESEVSRGDLDAMHGLFLEAAHRQITICVSAGDQGAKNNTGKLSLNYPASDPLVLSCGGTVADSIKHHSLKESAWPDGGGGVSRLFSKPDYQKQVNVPLSPESRSGRGIPDVSAVASRSAYRAQIKDIKHTVGGTSAVAPLWAGLILRMNEEHQSSLGFINPLLYRVSSIAFNDIRSGNNGHYKACKGWDPCTGLGSPRGKDLLSQIMRES